jgi:hypothetical protein
VRPVARPSTAVSMGEAKKNGTSFLCENLGQDEYRSEDV